MGATCGRLLAIDAQSGMKPRVGRPVGCSANGAQILQRKNVSKEIAFLCSSRSRHCGLGKEGGGDGWSLDGFQLTRCIDKLTLSFIEDHESLVHGNEILAGQIFGYDRQKKLRQNDHTFANIVAAVRKLVGGAEWYHDVLKDIARYIVLDALICNTDRHHENWGFLTTYQTSDNGTVRMRFRMAPSFDHASSLGRELLDDRASAILTANGVAAYAQRGHGGIYWEHTDNRGANPLELIKLASSKFPD
jgi:hypothetical protein